MRGTDGAPETGSENLRLTGRTTDGRTDGQWAKVVKMAQAAEPLEGLRTARIGSASRCQNGASCLQDAMTPPRGPPRIAS